MDPLIAISLVGLVLVCGGTILVVFLMVLRRFGGTAIAFFTSMLNATREAEKDDRGAVITAPKPDLRTIARRSDFDAAVAKHRVNEELAPRPRITGAPPPPSPRQTGTFPTSTGSTPPPSSAIDDARASDLRRRMEQRQRRANSPYRREHDDDDDEMIGGLLDIGNKL